jgi:PKD repeat protein
MLTPKRQGVPGIRSRRPIAVALTAAALTLGAVASAPAPAGAQGPNVAPSATVQGQQVQTGAVFQPLLERRATPRFGAPRAAYARAKRRAAQLARSRQARLGVTSPGVASPSRASAPGAAVVGSLDQPGVTAAEQIATFGEKGDITPPDTTGAIGPEDYVELVNSEIVAYARADLKRVGEAKDITEFVGDKKAGGDVCDPQIKYDPQTERWFYAAIECGEIGKENTLYVGFSKTSDPTDLSTAAGHGWCGYSYLFGTAFEDYPKLGLDAQHIIVGANSFNGKTEAFLTAHILSLPKPASGAITTCPEAPKLTTFGSAKEPLTTSFSGHVASTPEPATVADSSPNGYVVSADTNSPFSGKGSHIMIWQVGGTAEAPKLEAIAAPAVPAYTLPPPVPQPGSSDGIDSLDGRLTQAVAASDPTAGGEEAVWTQHTVAGGAGTVVRWYELLPAKAEARQVGTISDPNLDVFNAAIAPTLAGGAVVNYNTGSASELVKIMAQSRVPTAPLNRMSGAITLGSSSARDADFSCPSIEPSESCRWGDYAGASVDPTNGNVVWGSSQVNGAITPENDAQWATRNFALEADDVAPTASFTVSANPSVGVPVELDASASEDPDGTIASYKWNFGDGSEVVHGPTEPRVSHAYEKTGQYPVTLTVEDDAKLTTSVEHTVVVKGPQTISFTSTPPSPAVAGGPAYTVAAATTSGLAVSFTSASPSVCSVSGATVSFLAAGTCTIQAEQAGDEAFFAASPVTQSFAVAAATPAPTPLPKAPLPKPTPTPDSGFAGHASFNTKTGAITVSVTVANPGTFRWSATFPNGRFGVFASRAAKCKAGFLRLKGKCRPAKVSFGRGSKAVAAAGAVTFTITPTAAARKALKNAARRKKGVPVTITITFRSALGGAPVTHTALLTVKLKR